MLHLDIARFRELLLQQRREPFDLPERALQIVCDRIGKGFQFLGLAHERGAVLAQTGEHRGQRTGQGADLVLAGPGFELCAEIVMGDAIGRYGESAQRIGHLSSDQDKHGHDQKSEQTDESERDQPGLIDQSVAFDLHLHVDLAMNVD